MKKLLVVSVFIIVFLSGFVFCLFFPSRLVNYGLLKRISEERFITNRKLWKYIILGIFLLHEIILWQPVLWLIILLKGMNGTCLHQYLLLFFRSLSREKIITNVY